MYAQFITVPNRRNYISPIITLYPQCGDATLKGDHCNQLATEEQGFYRETERIRRRWAQTGP